MAVLSFDSEQTQGLLYSVGLHVALVLLLVFASGQGPVIKPPKGVAIQAEIMDLDKFLNSQNKPSPTPKKPDPEPPKPETKPEPQIQQTKPEPPKVEPKPEPKPVEKPVIKPKVDPVKRQEKTERQKRLEEIRRKRQAAEEQANKQPEVKTNSSADQPVAEDATPPVGVENGSEDVRRTKLTLYSAAIQAAVTRAWTRPTGTPAGLQCQIKVNQIPGGGVIDVSIGTPCNASAVARNSIINAVKKADPLPYKGFEDVFERRLTFTFQYLGD
ncbi:TonB C-terminal domain-containing protein [Marinicella sp. S1101]|uniref:TonB C-terminal domain-containing protein n=1 Tax=Marinicella marina TaxID=2996016 RepID=UPI002260A6C6|nr:TonB C-terminal domain-containing protein [Marinicella marina]MCX7553184.1 TonB C-terminal domain-containing protein [Marinicella marina]MDJ1138916.1 TonB C-terminal domain-containing protein [Marinicella marina]